MGESRMCCGGIVQRHPAENWQPRHFSSRRHLDPPPETGQRFNNGQRYDDASMGYDVLDDENHDEGYDEDHKKHDEHTDDEISKRCDTIRTALLFINLK